MEKLHRAFIRSGGRPRRAVGRKDGGAEGSGALGSHSLGRRAIIRCAKYTYRVLLWNCFFLLLI